MYVGCDRLQNIPADCGVFQSGTKKNEKKKKKNMKANNYWGAKITVFTYKGNDKL